MGSLLAGLFGHRLPFVADDNGGLVVPMLPSDPYADRWICRGMASPHALTAIARHYDLPMAAVATEFWRDEERSLMLLDSPGGWATLGGRIARGIIGQEAASAVPPVPVTTH
ncbi:MAG TPA: hypothetical protein VEZ70_14390 [Allosphingosinicella sp.]|nr:hypothetical protein [Allosphingosinicella sp.]